MISRRYARERVKSAIDKDAVSMYVAHYGISLLSDVGH